MGICKATQPDGCIVRPLPASADFGRTYAIEFAVAGEGVEDLLR